MGGGFAYATQNGDAANPLSILAQWPTESFLLGEGANPTWSQDGTQIAYDANGSIIRLSPLGAAFATISSSGSDRDPSWQPAPACSNGIDDDGDGKIDFDGGVSATQGSVHGEPDPGCWLPYRPNEVDPDCGLGAELALVMPLLRALRRARGRTSS